MTSRFSRAELAALADPKFDQHFLVDERKLGQIVAAAGIGPRDRVLEIGAGLGTVARELPPSASLTLIELDTRLIAPLRASVPHAEVRHGDALNLLTTIPFDVLISNLPHSVTIGLLALLPTLQFRVALVTMAESTDLSALTKTGLTQELVARIGGVDFSPPQESPAQVVKISRESTESQPSSLPF